MLRTRVLTAIILLPIVIGLIYLGGLFFLALVMVILTIAEFEFCRLMTRNDFRPTLAFGLAILWLFLLDAQSTGNLSTPKGLWLKPGLALILLSSLAWQLRRRQGSPVADWALTVTSGIYLGLCGASLIGLRELDDGFWWTLTVLATVMIADSGAYFVGKAWGRHKLAPALSPGKTWEGYLAGVVSGGLGSILLTLLRQALTGDSVGITHSLALGLLIGTLSPLGDLAISMIKRQVGAKDSGNLIPGHGGALDRIDSQLWAAVIGYYYVVWFASGALV